MAGKAQLTKDRLRDLNYKGRETFADYLDIVDYDDDYQVFLTRDGRFGRQWQLPRMCGEGETSETRLAVSGELSAVIDRYPETALGQFLRFTHADIRDEVAFYLQGVKKGGWSEDVARAVAGVHLRGALQGYFAQIEPDELLAAQAQAIEEIEEFEDKQIEFEEINRRTHQGEFALVSDCYLNFSMAPSWLGDSMVGKMSKKFALALGFGSLEDVYGARFKEEMKAFLFHCERIEEAMIAQRLTSRRVLGPGLLKVMYRMLNPERSRTGQPPVYQSRYPFIEHLNNRVDERSAKFGDYVAGSVVNTSPQGWEIEGWHYRIASALTLPEGTRDAMIQEALQGDSGEGWACVNFYVPPQDPVRFLLRTRRSLVETQKTMFKPGSLASPDPIKMKKREDDLLFLINATNPAEKNHKKVVWASAHCVVRDRDRKKANDRIKRYETGLWDSGHVETLRGDAVLHSTLPFNLRKTGLSLLKRYTPMLSSNMCDLLPLYTSFAGTGDSRLMFANSEGSPIFIDLFTRETHAAHLLIVGGTGSGKSFTENNILGQSKAQRESLTFIIDKGDSYETTCTTYGGEYVKLDLSGMVNGKRLCLNPFYVSNGPDGQALLPTEMEMDNQLLAVKAMLKSGTADEAGRTEEVKKESINTIERYLMECHKARLESEDKREVILSDLYNALEADSDPESKRLALRLRNYTVHGTYGKLFDGPLSISWDNPFIVFETGSMAASPAMDVVMLLLFAQIDMRCKRDEYRHLKKYVVVDEAWAVLAKKHLASALGGFARELRKYGGSLTLMSQGFGDFANLVNAEGNTDDGIMANMRHFIFLTAAYSDVSLATKMLSLNETDVSLWESCISVRPYFQEFFYFMRPTAGGGKSGKVRLYSSPLLYWMGSAHADDFVVREKLVKELIQSGIPAERARREAAKRLAKEYPYGVAYAKK